MKWSYPIFCPVDTEHFVFMGSQIIERGLAAATEQHADVLKQKPQKWYGLKTPAQVTFLKLYQPR